MPLSTQTTHYDPYCNLTTSYPTERDDELIIVLLLQMTSLACWERAILNTQPTTVRIVTWRPPPPPRGFLWAVLCVLGLVSYYVFEYMCLWWCPTFCYCSSFLFSVMFFFFFISSFVLWTQCYQFLWIVHSWLPFRFSLTFVQSRLTIWYLVLVDRSLVLLCFL